LSGQTARLVQEFIYHSIVGPANEVGGGPYGHRQYYEMKSGLVQGHRLTGKLLGSGSDWMLVGVDGFMRMDVRVQIQTDDGAIICAHYFGPAEVNQKLRDSFVAFTPTAFSDQSIRSHWMLETGDPRYAWVNQTVFVGEGRLSPVGPGVMGVEHCVYRVG
jgi:hypothetical protein